MLNFMSYQAVLITNYCGFGGGSVFVEYENRVFPYSAYYGEDLTFLLHLHRQAELMYVLEGEIEMRVEKHTQVLRKGDVGIAFPNCAHSYVTAEHCRFIIVIFDANLAGDCASTLLTQRPVFPYLTASDVDDDVKYLLPKIIDCKDTRLLKGYLQVIFAQIFGKLRLESTVSQDDGWTHRALQYLNEHFTESLSLDDLADHLGVSKYHLSRSFPEKIGCGLSAYLQSLRADHAAQLLASGDVSITQAGFDSGFESTTTFYRVFKQQYGLSPKAYRDAHRK